MEIIKVSKEVWLRGDVDSYLCRASDEKKCCLGIAAEHFGVQVGELRGVNTLERLKRKLSMRGLAIAHEEFNKQIPVQHAFDYNTEKNYLNEMYKVNDSGEYTGDDEARMARLNDILDANNAPFRFELVD